MDPSNWILLVTVLLYAARILFGLINRRFEWGYLVKSALEARGNFAYTGLALLISSAVRAPGISTPPSQLWSRVGSPQEVALLALLAVVLLGSFHALSNVELSLTRRSTWLALALSTGIAGIMFFAGIGSV